MESSVTSASFWKSSGGGNCSMSSIDSSCRSRSSAFSSVALSPHPCPSPRTLPGGGRSAEPLRLRPRRSSPCLADERSSLPYLSPPGEAHFQVGGGIYPGESDC